MNNPQEQREAARNLSSQLKSKFRFDLAMYTAKSQMESVATTVDNPTVLGESAINLIKMLLLQPGRFGYENLANLLRKQCHQVNYWDFKRALLHYLTYALPNTSITYALKERLPNLVLTLYQRHDSDLLSEALILRTCKRVVDILTTEDGEHPSTLFSMFLAQGNPLLLVIILLKISLFCSHVQSHLELRIASLIRYYEAYSEEDCRWVINFFEVFRVTFAVYASGTLYNLVQVSSENQATPSLSTYRIFSQLRDKAFDFQQVAAEIERNLLEDDPLPTNRTPAEVAEFAPADAIAS